MTNPAFAQTIEDVRGGRSLTAERMGEWVDAMLTGSLPDDSIADLLKALATKGETVDELVGAASSLRRHMRRIPFDGPMLLDTCGTGGSHTGTFNISTAVAIVTAACGVPVAKHGNRRITSNTGSADVLEVLGVTISDEPAAVADTLAQHGLCFCYAPTCHPAMRYVAEVRRKLKIKTLFNLLGPLCNPAAATHQILGTSNHRDLGLIAAALQQLGTTASVVLHADDGQDEVSLASPTSLIHIRGQEQQRQTITHDDFDLPPCQIADLAAENPHESAEIIRGVMSGNSGPARNTVVAGTAVALCVAGRYDNYRTAATKATQAIDSGEAQAKLNALKNQTSPNK